MKDGTLLRQYLDANRINKSDLADKMGIERSTLYSYFSTTKFRKGVADMLIEALPIESIDELRNKVYHDVALVPVYKETTAQMKDYEALKPEYFLTIPQFQDCTFACRVDDDSMIPRYKPGSIIICKELGGDYITPGKPYLIWTRQDQMLLLRYIMNYDVDVLLRASNSLLPRPYHTKNRD